MLTVTVIPSLERLCLPVLFKDISTDLNLNVFAIGTVWSMDPLAGVVIGIPGGLLADRFGVKRTLTVICLLAGILSALRGLSNGFLTLGVTIFLFGLVNTVANNITPKINAIWFSKDRLGLANALLNMSFYSGAMVATFISATILSPLLGGWRNVLFVLGIPAIVLCILWLITGREPAKGEVPVERTRDVPFRESFSRVMRIKEVWILGVIALAYFGVNTAIYGYVPLYLRNIGWTATSADVAFTIFYGSFVAGIVPMTFLADKLKARKAMFAFSVLVMAISLGLFPFVRGSQLYALIIVSCILRSAALPLFITLILEIKEVGGTYGGTAISFAMTFTMFGSVLAPLIGGKFASVSPGAPFIFWAILTGAVVPLFLLLRKPAPFKDQVQNGEQGI
jgi:MFS transporter, NNP family, nitrate/nitrite transporter